MSVLLWILQVLLAAAFLMHGLMLLAPPPDIAALMNAQLPRGFWIFLGIAEVLAAIGLTLPGLLRIRPTIWHLVRAEWSSAVITAVLLAMAIVVAVLRGGSHQIRARGA